MAKLGDMRGRAVWGMSPVRWDIQGEGSKQQV